MRSDRVLPNPSVMPATAETSDRGIHFAYAATVHRQARGACRQTTPVFGDGLRLEGRSDGFSEDLA